MSRRREPPIIVIDRHGKSEGRPEELTGWRRWAAVGAGYLVLALVVLVGIAAAAGLAMTALLVLAVALPLAALLALIGYVTGVVKVRRAEKSYSDLD